MALLWPAHLCLRADETRPEAAVHPRFDDPISLILTPTYSIWFRSVGVLLILTWRFSQARNAMFRGWNETVGEIL